MVPEDDSGVLVSATNVVNGIELYKKILREGGYSTELIQSNDGEDF